MTRWKLAIHRHRFVEQIGGGTRIRTGVQGAIGESRGRTGGPADTGGSQPSPPTLGWIAPDSPGVGVRDCGESATRTEGAGGRVPGTAAVQRQVDHEAALTD